jgi:hypothetical protein
LEQVFAFRSASKVFLQTTQVLGETDLYFSFSCRFLCNLLQVSPQVSWCPLMGMYFNLQTTQTLGAFHLLTL